jgi:hypothetical protein
MHTMLLAKLKSATTVGLMILMASGIGLWAGGNGLALTDAQTKPPIEQAAAPVEQAQPAPAKASAGERENAPNPATDLFGDALPAGAIARLGTVRFRAADGIDFLSYSPDGKRIVAQTQTTISVWDAETGQKQREFSGQNVGPLAWRADGSGIMLVYEAGGAIRCGDFTRESLKKSPQNFGTPSDKRVGGGQFNGYAISPDGKFLVAGRTGKDADELTIAVWELAPGKTLAELRKLHELGPQKGTCRQIIFSPDSTHVGAFSGPDQSRPFADPNDPP